MDREQAKLILSAMRPGRDSAKDDVLFEEALAWLENDPELAEWFAAHQEGDNAIREALRTIQPPAHLRESIIAGAKVIPLGPPTVRRFPLHYWMASAAAIVVGLVIFFLNGGTGRTPSLESQLARLTEKHSHAFASTTGNLDEVRAWLAERGGATDFTVPVALKNRGAIGCEVAMVNGTQVTILCFHLGERRTAHLYVMDRTQLAHPPTEGAPDFHQIGDVAVAGWSAGTRSYFLTERGDNKSLRQLL